MSLYGFQPIDNVPDYVSFSYSFNFFTVFAFVSATYSCFVFLIILKMIVFYVRNRHNGSMKNSLRLDVFRVFLFMQLWNSLHVLLDFMVVRIPLTSVLTSYCAASKPVYLLKTLSLLFTGCVYSSHLLTLLFCAQRVALLYANDYQKETISRVIDVLCPLLILGGHLLGLPHFFASNSCFQMAQPFPFGSVIITSSNSGTMPIYAIIYMISTQTTVVLIIAASCLMFAKLNQKRKLSSELHIKYNSQAEKTLTATISLILLPIVMPSLLSIADIFDYFYYPYLFVLRPICLDARAHIVTCYFYFTHPIFRQTNVEPRVGRYL